VKVSGKRLSPARAPKATAPDSGGSLTASKGNGVVIPQMPYGIPEAAARNPKGSAQQTILGGVSKLIRVLMPMT